MPNDLFIGIRLAAIVAIFIRPLAVLWRDVVTRATPLIEIAFRPDATWSPPAADYGEVIDFPQHRARARSFQAHRLQREPVDMSAGVGLRLAT